MLLPAHPRGQTRDEGLVDHEVVQREQQRPRDERDERHPRKLTAVADEEAGRRLRSQVHQAAEEIEQRDLDQGDEETEHADRQQDPAHLAQVMPVEAPHAARRHGVVGVAEDVDQRFEPAKDHARLLTARHCRTRARHGPG